MKKIVSLFLVLLMLTSLLAGCGGSGSEDLPKTGVEIDLEKETVEINYINTPMEGNGWALYNRSYTVNGKPAYSIGSASSDQFANSVVIMVSATLKSGEVKYTVEKLYAQSNTPKDIEIPVNGFLLAIRYNPKDTKTPTLIGEEFKVRKPLTLIGYSSYQDLIKIETTVDGSIEETEEGAVNTTRSITLKNPKLLTEDNTISVFDSVGSLNLQSYPETFGVLFKPGSKTTTYVVDTLYNCDSDKAGITIGENEFLVLFKGDYNTEYAKNHYLAGEEVKLRITDNLPSLSANPAVLLPDNSLVSVDEDAINAGSRKNNTLNVYTPDFNYRTTPTGSDFIDVRIVGGMVVEVCEPSQNCTIPANGYVLSFPGEKKALAEKIKVGDAVMINKIAATVLPEEYVRINGIIIKIDATNEGRNVEGMTCIYNPQYSSDTTGTNIYGYEITVQNNVITALNPAEEEGVSGNQPIPADGYVLSIHMDQINIASLFPTLKEGDIVEHVVEPYEFNCANFIVTVINPKERADTDVAIYDKNSSVPSTGTKASGIELIVRDGVIVDINRKGNTSVPSTGYLISIAKTPLADCGYEKSAFTVGSTVIYDEASGQLSILLKSKE